MISALLGTAYLVYLISYFARLSSGAGNSNEAVGAAIAAAIVMPHMVCAGVGVVFNWLGWSLRLSWAALVAGILFAVSMVLMFIYAVFVLPSTVLCFVAYAKMKKDAQRAAMPQNGAGETGR